MNDPSTEQTLKKVLDVMTRAFPTGGRDMAGGQQARNRNAQAQAARQEKQIIVGTTRSLQKLTGAANVSANSLTGLSKQVGKTKTNFSDLNSSMASTMKSLSMSRAEIKKINFGGLAQELQKAMAEAVSNKGSSPKGQSEELKNAIGATRRFSMALDHPRFGVTNRLEKFRKALGLVIGDIYGGRKGGPKATPSSGGRGGSGGGSTGPDSSAAANNENAKAIKGVTANLKSFIQKWKIGAGIAAFAGTGVQVLDDMFQQLAVRGYGTTDSLKQLYLASIDNGMSLAEYTQLMDDNMVAVSRASSFTAFQAQLKEGTNSLAEFGVFGPQAAGSIAALMTSSTALGVSQNDMRQSVSSQLGVFAELRKTTNITAKEFATMSKELSEDAGVRAELSTMNSQEKIARSTQLLGQIAYARSLNLSTREVQNYTQAVLAQRKTTVKERFQMSGRLTQAAGMLGMDAGKTERLQSLAKNKYKSEAEQKEFDALLAEVDSGIERMQQSGQPGSQYQADMLRENIAPLQASIDAAQAIAAAKKSGEIKNPDFDKKLGEGMQTLGDTMTNLSGLFKNAFAQMAVAAGATIIGIGAAILTAAPITGGIMGTVAGNIIAARLAGQGIGGVQIPDGKGGPGGKTDPKTSKGRLGGMVRGAGGALLSAAPVLIAGGLALKGLNDAENAEKAGDPEASDKKAEAIGQGIGSVLGVGVGAVLTGVLGAFTGGSGLIAGPIISGITGMLGNTLGGWVGKFVGGLSTSEKETKKNNEITKKLTDAQNEANENIKKGRGSDLVYSENIGNLGSTVIAAAQTMRLANQEEVQKVLDSKKTPEERKKDEEKKKAEAEAAKQKNQVFKVTKEQSDAADLAIQNDLKYGTPSSSPDELSTPTYSAPSSEKASGVAAQVMASPSQTSQKSVNLNPVNKQEEQNTKDAKQASSIIQNISSDPVEVLKQILLVLQQNQQTEERHADLTEQLIRSQAPRTAFMPGNQYLNSLVRAQS